VIPKLPYSFSYRFADADGCESEMQVLDWEAGELFWNCLRRHGSEETGLEKVRAKCIGGGQERGHELADGTEAVTPGPPPFLPLVIGPGCSHTDPHT
jgi:hypothetical protein